MMAALKKAGVCMVWKVSNVVVSLVMQLPNYSTTKLVWGVGARGTNCGRTISFSTPTAIRTSGSLRRGQQLQRRTDTIRYRFLLGSKNELES